MQYTFNDVQLIQYSSLMYIHYFRQLKRTPLINNWNRLQIVLK